MFLRKLTVLLVPLGLMLLLCLLIPLFGSMDAFFGPLLLGAVLGVMLALLLPLAGATRMREPFAWLLWIPAAVILLILLYQFLTTQQGSYYFVNGGNYTAPVVALYQFLTTQQIGRDIPVLRLLMTGDTRMITAESAFAAYMLAFSVRTGKGI